MAIFVLSATLGLKYNFIMKLLSDQSSAINKLDKYKVGALFMKQGTGKTRVACELVNSIDCDLVAWVGPLNTLMPKEGIPSIIDEINKWGGFNAKSVFYGIESIQSSDRIYFNLLDDIGNSKNPFIVIDESLKIKNINAKRTKRMLNLSEIVKYKLILNGTPLSKNLLDLYSQMYFLSPLILNMGFTEFKNTFCEYTKVTKNFGYKSYSKEFITGYENIDYLYSLIQNYVFECDLSLNVNQLFKNVDYSIDEHSLEEYYFLKEKYLDDEMLLWKNNNIFLELTQKMQHTYCCTEEKFDVVNDYFKTIPQNKSIIYCKYVKSRQMCEKYFPAATVLSYQKESLGLNLQHLNHTIYFDKIWDLALRSQASARTFRTGQEYDCYYLDLSGNVGLEKLIDKNIQKKVSMLEYFKKTAIKNIKNNL